MTNIKIWAPEAESMMLILDQQKLPMAVNGAGWWSIETSLVKHDTDYAFSVDEAGPFPDPRSGSQPAGVHGLSRWVDHGKFQWSDHNWQQQPLASAVIYELHIGTFTDEGTFDSASSKLNYLVGLGITHIELMPVAEFPGCRGWGYDGVHLYAPHSAYGGPDGLKRFVNTCHQLGLAVVLDVVYNHLGPSGNYLSKYGPYFTKKYSTPWGEAVNFDGAHSDEVRRFFIDNALMWLRDYHIDGLRIDAVHAIIDSSAQHFLKQLAQEVESLQTQCSKHFFLIAESDLNDPRVIEPRELGGYGLPAQWNEDFHHALHTQLTGEDNGYYQDFGTLDQLAKSLSRGFVYDGCYSKFRKRKHGAPSPTLTGANFVGYLQNHDQIGNRALGDRINQSLTLGQTKIGAALVLTSPFIPMLFQGEEWAATTPFLYFTDHQDQTLADAVSNGRKKEFASFGWSGDEIPDPQDEDTFQRSKLRWSEQSSDDNSVILAWYRNLLALRKEFPELMPSGFSNVTVKLDTGNDWLLMMRGGVSVVINFATRPCTLSLDEAEQQSLILGSEDSITKNGKVVYLPAHSVAIFVF